MKILAAVATDAELAVLAPALVRAETLVCGVGLLETALSLTRRLSRGPMPDLIVSLGIGGGFAASGAGVLDVCVATAEVIADFGICRAPVVEPFDEGLAAARSLAAPGIWRQAFSALPPGSLSGPFVSVNAVTADADRAAALWEQYSPVCENMEGAAVARVAAEFRVDWLELRAVSNLVGPRDRDAWRVRDALARLAAALPAVTAALEH